MLLASSRQRRDSRSSMIASPPATTQAMPLAQTGIETPLTITSQPCRKRTSCNTDNRLRKTMVRVVKGFMSIPPLRQSSSDLVQRIEQGLRLLQAQQQGLPRFFYA